MDRKEESYTIGDTVKKTQYYAKMYPNWKIEEGVILDIDMKTISDDKLTTPERGRYRARYTYQPWYPIFDMVIECKDPSDGHSYMLRVSQFDFNKD
jgi:hypothetical protein